MDKPYDMDDTTLLSRRFHALMNRFQNLINELDLPLSGNGGGAAARPSSGCKAYTVHSSDFLDERRKHALIKVIDDALKQIDHLDSADVENASHPEPTCRTNFHPGKKVFTSEELHFLEETLRTCHPASVGDAYTDR